MTPDEEWRPVVGYEGLYEVSDRGQVRSLPRRLRGRILRPGLSAGYPSVNLSVNGVGRVVKVHILLAEAFLGPRPDGSVTCHADGDRSNNVLSNLRYDTVSSNNLDTVRHGNHWQAAKTHCKHGHEYTPENTIRRPEGHRRCRTCTEERERRRYGRKVA